TAAAEEEGGEDQEDGGRQQRQEGPDEAQGHADPAEYQVEVTRHVRAARTLRAAYSGAGALAWSASSSGWVLSTQRWACFPAPQEERPGLRPAAAGTDRRACRTPRPNFGRPRRRIVSRHFPYHRRVLPSISRPPPKETPMSGQ